MPVDPISAALAIGPSLWEALSGPIVERSIGIASNKWRKFAWKNNEDRYKRRLLDLYSTTKLLGNPKPIRLDKVYTDVYVLNQITAYRRLKIDEKSGGLRENSGRLPEVSRKPLLEIVKDRSRVYVLGKPGAGKSTFLRILCLLCCKGEIPRTPIFVSLKEWHDSGLPLEKFIVDEFRVCGFPDAEEFFGALMESGLVLLLLDGLDEIPPDQDARQRAITSLTRLARQYPTAQMVLTCRIAAAEYSFDQFDYFEIADFTEAQQADFVQKWYSSNHAAHSKFSVQWKATENSGLRDLARTPLLLALLCLAFDETLSFPKRRVELYQEATNALLRKWDASRGIRRDDLYRSLSHIRREQLLSRIAIRTFSQSKLFFPANDASEIISEYLSQLPPRDESRTTDAADVLKAIEAQHGLLVERAVGIYSYSHLTLHEYFAAKYLAEAAQSKVLSDAVRAHLFADSWREVFLMTASMMDDATPLFASIERLFTARFFGFQPLTRVIEKSQYQSAGAVADPAVASRERASISQPLLALLDKCQDLCFTLAASFHFIRCGELARSRVRLATTHIVELVLREAEAAPNAIKLVRQVNDYLQACTVVTEALQVASLSNRDQVVERLIFPQLGTSFGAR